MLRMEIALFLVLALLGAFLLPISYVETPQGSYSAGPYAVVSYAGVAFYLVLCAVLLFGNWRSLDRKKQMCIRDRGKCVLFKAFGDVDAFPLCVKTHDVDEFVNAVVLISGSFGGINLEDISAPRCFEIERKLKEKCDIPTVSYTHLRPAKRPPAISPVRRPTSMLNWRSVRKRRSPSACTTRPYTSSAPATTRSISSAVPVSYTHLDVYKRQVPRRSRQRRKFQRQIPS